MGRSEELAGVRREGVGNASWVALAYSETGSQARRCRGRNRIRVSGWDGIHRVGVSSLVCSCSAVVVSAVVSSVLCCAPVIVTSRTTLSSSIATLLLSSLVLIALRTSVGGSTSIGESTGVGSSRNDGWYARTANIVRDHIGLGRNGSGCYGKEHAFVDAINETEKEGQATWVALALSGAVGCGG